ncbi:MAG: sigma-70 family RNA polymerase sigma factor [Pseudosphingobacterium sp.]|nr:sigma-70 family RNA polymerase sigma factor [Olivibacter sp. UJ_SKK_5.1]MDX3914682.1 sigma-70 family RNA polymerase sigma factor [Pseudosphingobacterium sp.]
MHSLADNALFQLVQQDNERAFVQLFDRYKQQLYRQVFGRIGEVQATQDILQEIFISVWRNRKTIEISDSLAPYLFNAARNLILQFYLKNKQKLQYLDRLTIDEPWVHSAEDQLIARESKAILDAEIGKLPENMKKIFILRKYQHQSIYEIAQQLGLSEQTVKNNLSIALKILRKRATSKELFLLYILFWFP